MLEGSSELISREDRDIADSVREVLEQKGIVFRLNARVQSVKDSDVIYRDAVTGEEHQLHADAILLATGRRPNTAGLNLAAAGVEVNERGAIVVDDYLQTTNPKIHAIGDVKGGLQFTYISLDDYRILREDLFGAGERKVSDRDPVSYSVFIDPPLSRIGLSEAEARKKGLNIKVNKLPVAAIPRARTLGDTLLLSAGKGSDVSLFKLFEVDEFKNPRNLRVDDFFGEFFGSCNRLAVFVDVGIAIAFEFKPERYVVVYVEVREQRVTLKDGVYRSFVRGKIGYVFTVK